MTKPRTKKKAGPAPKPQCEVRTRLACTGEVVRRMTGTKRGDPVFNCCLGCASYLSRQGVKLREVSGAEGE